MKNPLQKFYELLDRPLFGAARIVLGLAVIPLALSFTQPLWRISMEAAQYPKGLTLDIHAHKLEGGNDGVDIDEINTLNHYIGMAKIDRASMADLDWIPFALGALVVLALRVAAIGNVRMLLDLAVLTGYVTLFAFGRFAYRLYTFGHNLSPDAPMEVEPFMPVLLGTRQVANFTTHSFPHAGSALLGLFVATVVGVTLWHLVTGRLAAARVERTSALTPSRLEAHAA